MDEDPDTPDHHVTQSTILYLLQEASKLAVPAQNSLLDSNLSLNGHKKSSMQVPFLEGDPHSFKVRNFQKDLCPMGPFNQANKVTGVSQTYKSCTLVKPSPQSNTPWEVMSLINIQCERLLHHRDLDEVASSSELFYSTLNNLPTHSSTSTSGEKEDHYIRCSALKLERPSADNLGELREANGEESSSSLGQRCCKDSAMCSNYQTPSQKIETFKSGLGSQNTTEHLPPAYRDTMEVKLSVITGLELNKGSQLDCVSVQQNSLNVTRSENTLSQPRISSASDGTLAPLNQRLTYSSYKDTGVAVNPFLSATEYPTLEQAPTLDFNSNRDLNVDPVIDPQLPSQHPLLPSQPSALAFMHRGMRSRVIEENGQIAAFQQEWTPQSLARAKFLPASKLPSLSYTEETCLPASQQCITTSKPEWSQMPVEVTAHQMQQQCSQKSTRKIRTSRKQPHPTRSADIQDPDLKGVTFRMHTELDDSREQCRLQITSNYSKARFKSVKKARVRSRLSQSSLITSSSDEESDPKPCISSKVCASCCTNKTPMWRDAEDSTPLCNACGIRYKKYRVRCMKCWYIPKKNGTSNLCCLKCGNFGRLSSAYC